MVLSVEGLPTIEGFLSLPNTSISNSYIDSTQSSSQSSSWTTRWCILLDGALHVYANRMQVTGMGVPKAIGIIPLSSYQQLKVAGDYENSEWDLTLSGSLPKISVATPTPSGSLDNCASPSTSKQLPRSATSGSLSAMFMRFGGSSSSGLSKSPRHDQSLRSQSPSEESLSIAVTSSPSCRPVSRGSSITSFAPSSFHRHTSLLNPLGSRNSSRRNSGSNGTLSLVAQADEIPEKRTWGRLSSRSKKIYNFVTNGLPNSSSNLAAELRGDSGNQQMTPSSPTSPCSPTSQFWGRMTNQSLPTSRSPSIAQSSEEPIQVLTLRAPDATSMVRWAEAISTSLNSDVPVIPKDPILSQPARPSTSRSKRTPLSEVTEALNATVRAPHRDRRSLSSGSIFAPMAPTSEQELKTTEDRKASIVNKGDLSLRAAKSSADLLSSGENCSFSPTSYSFSRQTSSSPSEPRYSTSTNTTMASSPPMVERILPPEEIIATIDRLRSERANHTQGLGLTGIKMEQYHTSIPHSEQRMSKASKSVMGHLTSSKQPRPSTSPSYSDAGSVPSVPPSFTSSTRISEDQQSNFSNRNTNLEAASAAAIAIISKQTAGSEIGSPQLLRESIAESPSMVSRSLPVPPRKSRSFLALDQKRENDSPRINRTHSPKKELQIKMKVKECENKQSFLPPSSSDLLRKNDGLDAPSSPKTNKNALQDNHENFNHTPKNHTNTNTKSFNLAKSAKMQKRISRSLELGNEDFIKRSTTNKENVAVII